MGCRFRISHCTLLLHRNMSTSTYHVKVSGKPQIIAIVEAAKLTEVKNTTKTRRHPPWRSIYVPERPIRAAKPGPSIHADLLKPRPESAASLFESNTNPGPTYTPGTIVKRTPRNMVGMCTKRRAPLQTKTGNPRIRELSAPADLPPEKVYVYSAPRRHKTKESYALMVIRERQRAKFHLGLEMAFKREFLVGFRKKCAYEQRCWKSSQVFRMYPVPRDYDMWRSTLNGCSYETMVQSVNPSEESVRQFLSIGNTKRIQSLKRRRERVDARSRQYAAWLMCTRRAMDVNSKQVSKLKRGVGAVWGATVQFFFGDDVIENGRQGQE